jgi:DNA-binding NarL/FixJ family response regulator
MYKRMVTIVEDNDLLRSLLATALENAGFAVTTAANASDAQRVIDSIDPDAVVLDIDLGDGNNGLDIADSLARRAGEVAVVFLTALSDPRFIGRDIKSVYPQAAYLNKHLLSDTNVLVDALETVLNDRDVTNFRHDRLPSRPLANLSNLQIQVLRLIAEGRTNQQIASIRGRSLAATESAVKRTLKAIGVDVTEDINARVVAARTYMNQIAIQTTNSH